MLGDVRVLPGVQVPLVLVRQGGRVVLQMTRDERLVPLRLHHRDPGLLRGADYVQVGVGHDVLGPDLGVPGLWHEEAVVESSDYGLVGDEHAVLVYPRDLGRHLPLLDAVVVVQPRHGAPADVERRAHVGERPVHDGAELVPVVDVLVIDGLQRSAGDDHPVELAVADLIERPVEPGQVFGGGVLGLVGRHLQQRDVGLQRAVTEAPQDLCLGLHLRGHQVQDEDLQRTDVLGVGPPLSHDEDVLGLQDRSGRQVVGDLDGHWITRRCRGSCTSRRRRAGWPQSWRRGLPLPF